ncbi:hypothetical protein CEXT_110661 [Caerostris extrusa]|uniref:RING-type domain-containing protein n=1 Tax=Caerostris extrusa TaxID=172846 RepID=A0AAV4MR15_CAEEX|nr:hypothetical protein CEXT_110661 [Caerostris extrusa]
MVGVQNRKRQPMRSKATKLLVRQDAIECKNSVKEADTTSALKCSICLDTTKRKKMKSPPCRHAFQQLCLDEFLKKNGGCPIREDIVHDDSSDWCPCVMYLRLIQSRNSQG